MVKSCYVCPYGD